MQRRTDKEIMAMIQSLVRDYKKTGSVTEGKFGYYTALMWVMQETDHKKDVVKPGTIRGSEFVQPICKECLAGATGNYNYTDGDRLQIVANKSQCKYC